MSRASDAYLRKVKDKGTNYSRSENAINKRRAGLDTLNDDYTKLSDRISSAYGGWQDKTTMEELEASVNDMNERLKAYDKYARGTGMENANSISDLTTNFSKVASGISNLRGAYGGYQDKTAFDSAVRIEKEKESAKKYHTEADYDKRIQELTEERSKLKGMDTVPLYNAIQSLKKLKTDFSKNPNSKYEALRDAEDFEEKSKAVEGRGGNTKANQQMYKFINNPVVPKKSDNPDVQRINEANQRLNQYNKVTDDEKALYNYLYNSGRYEEAEDYINNLGLSSRVLEAQKDYATEQYRNMNGLQRTFASLVMIPANIGLSAYNGVVDLANMATGGNLTGNDVYEGFKTIGQSAEQAASLPHELQSQIMGEKFGKAGQLGYEAVYSALNSLAGVSALGHGFEVVMGLGAAHDTYNELSQTDTPMAQTIIKSLSAGVLEALFEHLPTETLLQMSKNTTSLRQLVANLLKVGAEEGLEEAGTEASNNLVDLIVGQISEAMGGENTSKLKGAFDEYVARGYSAPEAKEMVFKDVLQNVTTAGVTGALSGMLMGGSSAIDLGINNSVGKQVIHPEALAEVAKTYGSDFADYVAKLQNNPTNAEKGAIYRQISDKVDASTLNLIGKWTEGKEDTDLENKVVSARANVEKSVTKTEADEQREGDKRSDAEIVQSMGSEYAEDVQKVFTDNYEGQNPYEYKALFDLAYENGARATGLSEVLTSQNISADAIKNIYKAGVSSRSVVESKLNEITKDFSKLHIKKGMGRFDDSAVDTGKLTKAQKETVALLHAFSDKMGVNITLYQSTAEEQKNGKPNGFYDPKTNTIHVDVNAGLGGTKIQEAIIIPTVSHEITHWSKTKALDLYNKLSESVFDALYESDGVSADARIEAEKERLLKNEGIEADDDYARDEVVARACEDMLKNSKTVDKYLKKMNTKELSTFKEKVAEIFDSIIEFFHELASAFSSEKAEAIAIRQMEDKAKKLQKQWDAMLDKAIQTNKGQLTDAQLLSKADAEILSEAGLQYDEESQSFSSSDVQNGWRSLEDETMSTSEYLTNRDKVAEVIAKQMSKLNGTTIEEEMKKAQDYINDIAVTYMFYKANLSTLDFVPSEGRSTIVSNSEYGFSFDTNTECAKRRIFTGTFTEIQKILGNRVITADEVLQIRQMLLDRDLQATCGLCYVEGSRVHMGEYNEVFLKKYAATNPPYVPTMYEVNTPDGNEELRLNHPEAYEALEFFYNHGGRINQAEVDKKVESLFSSQAKPKMYTLRTEYKGEIRDLFTIKKGKNKGKVDEKKVANKNKNGGGRFQSFSDFEIVHLLDVMQAISDCSYVGLGGQAYTKVESFAKVFGDTNLKINLSLIAKDVDKNGNLIFDDREGINSKNAFEIRENHSKNVGTVIVVFNDEQLKSALKDSRIDYVLPFHRSQWSKAQYGLMGLPKDTKEYTSWQNESYIKDANGNQVVEHLTKAGNVRKRPANFMPNEYWDYSKNGRANAETYLKMCADDGRLPKFSFLLIDNGDNTYSLPEGEIGDNYFKLLIDFKMYDNDGVGSPQLPMIPNFNMDETMKLLNEYEGGHNSFPVAQEVVDEFVKGKTPVYNSSRFTEDFAKETVEKAEKLFGTTAKLDEMGYLDINGKILDFSGKYNGAPGGYRTVDHRDVYDVNPALHTGDYSSAMINFMNMGNIRLVPESAGVDISVKPNEKQIEPLRNYIRRIKQREGYFMLDISSENGDRLSNKEYEKTTTTDAIMQDIMDYFDKGVLPDKDSYMQYSSREIKEIESEYSSALKEGNMEKMKQLVREYAVAQGYNRIGYHGTDRWGFTAFNLDAMKDRQSIFLTDEMEVASSYSNSYGTKPLSAKLVNSAKMSDEELVSYVNNMLGSDRYEIIKGIGLNKFADKYILDIKNISDRIRKFASDGTLEYILKGASKDIDLDKIKERILKVAELTQELADVEMSKDEHLNIELDRDAAMIAVEHLAGSRLAIDIKILSGMVTPAFYDAPPKLRRLMKAIDADEGLIFDKILNDIKSRSALSYLISNNNEKGILDLAFKLNNPYVVNTKGSNWNELPEIESVDSNGEKYQNITRGYAQYAKDNGYDGVIFKNIYDMGQYADDFFKSNVYVVFNPNHVKSLDAVTYDDNGDPIPLSKRFDDSFNELRYSSRDIGYHAGDLGKAEWLSQQYGSRRDTGHFGTGTYFVGDEDKINIGGYKERPRHAVDFTNYNLYRPNDENKAFALHRFLGLIENGIEESWIDRLEALEFKAIDKFKIMDFDYDDDESWKTENIIKKYQSAADLLGINYESEDEFFESSGYTDVTEEGGHYSYEDMEGNVHEEFSDRSIMEAEYEEYIKETVDNYIEKVNDRYEYLKHALSKIRYDFSFRDWANALRKVAQYQKMYKDGHVDSYATVFMKALGYEGVDVRHLKNLDNTGYGSVIYDLKEPTIFYSSRDVDYDVADADEAVERIISENRLLGEDLKILNTMANNSTMNISDSYAKTVAEKVISKYGSKADASEVSKLVKNYYKVLLKGNVDVIDLFNLGGEIGDKILDSTDKFSDLKGEVGDYLKSDMKRAIIMDLYEPMWKGVKFPNTDITKKIAKMNETISDLKKEHNERISKIREHYKDAAKKSNAEIKAHYKDLMKKYEERVKDRYDKRAAGLKDSYNKKIERMRESEARKRELGRITKYINELSDMLIKNTKEKHVNEALKPAVKEILDMVNEQTSFIRGNLQNKSLAKALDKVNLAVKRQFDEDNIRDTVDRLFDNVDDDLRESVASFADELAKMEEDLHGKVLSLDLLDAEHLNEMANIFRQMLTIVKNTNKAFGQSRRKQVIETSNDLLNDIRGYERSKLKDKLGVVGNMFDYDLALPYYFFQRIGETGVKEFFLLFDGFDSFAFLCDDLDVANNEYYERIKVSDDDIRNWRNDSKKVTYETSDGNKISFVCTTAQLMTLYDTARRLDAKLHLEEGGFQMAKSDKNGTMNGFIAMNTDDIIAMCKANLEPKQIAVAEHFQEEMSTTGAKLGNEVTRKRWGIDKFSDKNYIPMKVAGESETSERDMENGHSIFRLLNPSFANELKKGAKNPLIIDDIFAVYTNHMTDMAKYNTLALPLLDFFRVWNYKEDGKLVVKEAIKTAFGEGANNYIKKFLIDLNGTANSGIDYMDSFTRTMIRNYKIAAVGANIRVGLLQPTAYFRAGYTLPKKYLTASLADIAHAWKHWKDCKKNCGIARWKSMGYYGTNVSRSVTEKIGGGASLRDKIAEKSGILAEFGDSITWGLIYHACELEAKDKGLTGEAALPYVTKRFREVVVQSQVVDSTMTRTQAMRSQSALVQMATAFKSEPMMSFNMLTNGFYEYEKDKQKYGKAYAFKKNGKKVANAFGTWIVTLLAASLVGSAADWFRDEDKEFSIEDYLRFVGDNALQDTFSLIPLGSDFYSLLNIKLLDKKGFNLQRMDEQFLSTIYNAFKQWGNGEFNYKDIYMSAKAFSQVTGIPISNVIREFKSLWDTSVKIWNTVEGETYPSMKIK